MISASASLDPNWSRYFVWPADYFPFNLPSCTLERANRAIGGDEARIVWRMSSGLPLIARIDDEAGHVLEELPPRPGGGEPFETVHRIQPGLLGQTIGLAFSWAFYVPLIDYVPRHPLGVVKIPGADLRGMETVVTITDTRPPERR